VGWLRVFVFPFAGFGSMMGVWLLIAIIRPGKM
jgi:hypothetical protein